MVLPYDFYFQPYFDIMESRRLKDEQDVAFQESLQADIQKVTFLNNHAFVIIV